MFSELKKLSAAAEPEIEDSEDDLRPRPDAGVILARLALEASLHAAGRRELASTEPLLMIVLVPDPDWVPVMQAAIGEDQRLVVRGIVELERRKGIPEPAGRDYIKLAERSMRVALITPDVSFLHPDVVLAADLTVTVKFDARLYRAAIHAVTGQRVRGLSDVDLNSLSLGVLISSLRRDSARACVERVRRAAVRLKGLADVSIGPTLADLPLTRVVREWSDDILWRIKTGAEIPFACLEGPPGGGKTTIAAALARSARWTFVSTDVGAWFSQSDGNLGGVIQQAKAFFGELTAGPPKPGIVGFLDEIDAIPNRSTLTRDPSWWTPVVTAILTEIDALKRSGRKVLLLGATNHFDRLDPALVRAGRLETRVPVLLPDVREREDLLRHYAADALDPAELATLARLSAGATPATIAAWIRDARNAAARRGAGLSFKDVLDRIVPPERDAGLDRLIAVHEAGHAVAALEVGLTLTEVSGFGSGSVGGWTGSQSVAVLTRDSVEARAIMMLGGRAADVVVSGAANSGAQNDLEAVNQLLWSATVELGLWGNLQTARTMSASNWGTSGRSIHAVIADELDRLMALTLATIERRRSAVLALADALLKERILTGERAAQIVRTASVAVKRRPAREQAEVDRTEHPPPRNFTGLREAS